MAACHSITVSCSLAVRHLAAFSGPSDMIIESPPYARQQAAPHPIGHRSRSAQCREEAVEDRTGVAKLRMPRVRDHLVPAAGPGGSVEELQAVEASERVPRAGKCSQDPI